MKVIIWNEKYVLYEVICERRVTIGACTARSGSKIVYENKYEKNIK